MSNITKQDTNGVKPLLGVGEFGYDNYPAGGDVGRVFVGTGSANIALAKKSEVDTAVATTNAHTVRVDNPHAVTKAQVGLSNADNTSDNVKNVLSATKWTTARTITLNGDVSGSVSVDGSANVTITTSVQPNSIALGTDTSGNYVAGLTQGTGISVTGTAGEGWSPTIALTDVGTVGTYTKVTTNSKGQITVGDTLVAGDIPNLDTSKITTGTLPVGRGGTGVTTVTGTGSVVLNTSPTLVTPNIGIAIGTSFNSITGLASVAPLVAGTASVGTSTLTARQDHVHPVQTTISGNANTATKLATARTINGVSFDGSANIAIVDITKAPLASPTFTGIPKAPTAAVGTSNTVIATTEFVNAEIANDAIPRVVSTDKAIARYNGTTGDLQNSTVTLDDNGNIGSGTQSFNGFGGSGIKNYIINGNFDIWQYKDALLTYPQTSSGYGSCDRWIHFNTGSTKTTSAVVTNKTEPFNAIFYCRTVVASIAGSGNAVGVQQRIECVNTLHGKTCTLSFYAKADSNKNIAVDFVQYFGSGGTPSGIIEGISATKIQITSSWVKYKLTVSVPSIAGKLAGTGNNDSLGVRFWFDAGSNFNAITANLEQQSGTFDIAQVQLEEGSVATPFEQRPYGLELSLCQRYFQLIRQRVIETAAASGYASISTTLPVTMRASPTIISTTTHSAVNVGSNTVAVLEPNNLSRQISAASTGAIDSDLTYLLIAEL